MTTPSKPRKRPTPSHLHPDLYQTAPLFPSALEANFSSASSDGLWELRAHKPPRRAAQAADWFAAEQARLRAVRSALQGGAKRPPPEVVQSAPEQERDQLAGLQRRVKAGALQARIAEADVRTARAECEAGRLRWEEERRRGILRREELGWRLGQLRETGVALLQAGMEERGREVLERVVALLEES